MKIGKIVNGDLEVHKGKVLGTLSLTAIVSAILAILGFWMIDIPGYDLNRELAQRAFQMELLDHSLRDSIAAERRESLRILLLLDILECDELSYKQNCEDLKSLVEDTSWIPPRWAEIGIRYNSSLLEDGRYEGPYQPQILQE